MRIEFEGTMAEFRALFQGGLVMEFEPSEAEAEEDEIRRSFAPPLSVVTEEAVAAPESAEPASGWADPGESIAAPSNDAALAAANTKLPSLSPEQREAAWSRFKTFCNEWIHGLGDEQAEQPDRLAMMQDLGQGRWPVPVLVMAYEIGSLQRLIEKALLEEPSAASFEHQRESIGTWLDYIDQIAANMVQVSHMGFPDLAGTYDYSTKWKRS